MDIELIKDIDRLRLDELIEKYITPKYTIFGDLRLRNVNKILVIILAINNLQLDINQFIKSGTIEKYITPKDLSEGVIYSICFEVQLYFEIFISWDFISLEDKISYINDNFENTKSVNVKTFYYHVTHFTSFIEKINEILSIEIEDFIRINRLNKFILLLDFFLYNKDFTVSGLIFFDSLDIPSIREKFRSYGKDKQISIVEYFDSLLDFSKDSFQPDFIHEIILIFEYIYKRLYITDYSKYINTLSYLFRRFNCTNLIKIIESIERKIEEASKIEIVEDCKKIYEKLIKKDVYGEFEQGCCHDINGIECKNFIVDENGLCLCQTPAIYGKKYLKYKQKYLTIKKHIL